ncbi:hypothetical protein GMST_14260 [Geomonas silvestris]|uniref:DUF6788 domain-containing protein n=1 Tax=Geomonas silvestris TaxID=2740184 RepID=A0A6V8MGI4_9BACT|nr:hypothetical protein [Geomonas silvestris]GFO59101.1 hypothetical protein GMST_14260 [Geomonas silvestris]
MKTSKKDPSVYSMLQSEHERCLRAIRLILEEIARLPKGSLSQRKIKSNGKEYVYPCLRYREGAQVKFQHISATEVDTIAKLIERKKKLRRDVESISRRRDTIADILKKGGFPLNSGN